MSRRIFLYWVLLLVPTLAVGTGAILLLARERERIAEQSTYAREGRQAATQARTRLIVESAELLLGDVQALLLDTLAEQPERDLDRFLSEWKRANPLVRTAFRVSADGNLLWPSATTMDDEGRGFIRKFGQLLKDSPVWRLGAGTPAAPAGDNLKVGSALTENERDAAQLRQDVSWNVQQVQSARRGVQDLIKNSASAANSLAQAPAAAAPAQGQAAETAKKPSAGVAAPSAAKLREIESPERRGWWPVTLSGRLQLLGWVQKNGEVRGVEVEMAALLSRLTAALPAESATGEGYALRDASGQILHRTGGAARSAVARVPFATDLLPGWDVVAYLPDIQVYDTAAGAGFFGTGVLLVTLMVVAILAGGSLLLWQARSSMVEAAQKTSFVANVSHEFKTPLTTIRLYSELLEQGRVRSEEQGREYLRTIGRETQRLARLVNNALDFSRLEQGRKKYACETLDLRDELGRLFQTHAPRLAEAGLTLNWELPAEPVSAVVDRDALEQIMLNLLDNACKYAAEGGEVAVALKAGAGGGAVVCVADRGPGVPAEQREKIFDKFHRVDETLTAEKTGTGLGLSIARQLARGLGGELRCMARDGGGAEFILTLA